MRRFAVAAALACFWSAPALADHTIGAACSPAGGGSARFADANNEYCNGTTWQYPAYQFGATSASCSSTNAGQIKWTGSDLEACNGTSWAALVGSGTGVAPAGALGDGYFVMTSGAWGASDLGDLAGANALCLTDLTNNDWKNKSTAVANGQLVSGKVKAFLCDWSGPCNNATPLARYYFAVSGYTPAGGAYFDTDSSGFGPNNSYAWSASNYFNGSTLYWSGRDYGSTTLWAGGYTGGTGTNSCYNWSNPYAAYAIAGDTSATDNGRWISSAQYCSGTLLPIICLVNP